MEFKNEIQKRSPMLHVKCRKAASSGEACRGSGNLYRVNVTWMHLNYFDLYTCASFIPDQWVYLIATSKT